MKKQLLIFICLTIYINMFGQSASVESFEVYTGRAYNQTAVNPSFNRDSIMARISNIPDTAGMMVTFVVTANPLFADSLLFTLTDNQNQTVYNGRLKVSSLSLDPGYKLNGKTIYYTVGPYPHLKKFTATVKIRGKDGSITPVKSFAKN